MASGRHRLAQPTPFPTYWIKAQVWSSDFDSSVDEERSLDPRSNGSKHDFHIGSGLKPRRL